MIKKIISLACVASFITPCFLTSCSKSIESDVRAISLYTDIKFLNSGQTAKFRAINTATGRRVENINWKIIDSPSSLITINSQGLLKVSNSLDIQATQKITIFGSLSHNRDVNSTIDVYLTPKSSSDFVGFVDNKLQYLDRQHNIKEMSIIESEPYTYVTMGEVDLFLFDSEKKPEGFTSLIKFEPIILGSLYNIMSFERKCKVTGEHGISWTDGYYDLDWYDGIPDFWATNIAVSSEDIIVHFACDSRVTLTVKCNIWSAPEQDTPCTMSYFQKEDDPHTLQYQMKGLYSSPMYCASYSTSGIVYDIMSDIYVYRQKGEYTELEFIIDRSDVDPIIRQAIKPKIKWTTSRRPLDCQTVYHLDVSFTIDYGQLHDASFWHYKQVEVCKILSYDPLLYSPSAKTYTSILTYNIVWI